MTFSPTYGMYDVSAAINNIDLLKIPLSAEFKIDIEKLTTYFEDATIKLMFICSPNNPTGNLMDKASIEFILQNFNGIVVLDEAYIDFAENKSALNLIGKYNNLIVSQTFSKARGLAAARVGIAYSNTQIITLYNKVKPPYNVSELNQKAAINALENKADYQNNIETIISEKASLEVELSQIKLVKKIYPSDANFLLIEIENVDEIYDYLVAQKIVTRNRNKLVKNCLRITVGTPNENKKLISALKNI